VCVCVCVDNVVFHGDGIMIDNRVLTRLFGPENKDEARGRIKLLSETLHKLYTQTERHTGGTEIDQTCTQSFSRKTWRKFIIWEI
jgi:hypothetical protein